MTWLKRNPGDISNVFDRVVQGVGHRGSSFTDVDRLLAVHTWGPRGRGVGEDRFLFIELKCEGEAPISLGQGWVLEALAKLPRVTVWGVRRVADDLWGAMEYGGQTSELLTDAHLRALVAAWWKGMPNPWAVLGAA